MNRDLLGGVLVVVLVGLVLTVAVLQSRHDKRHIREYLLDNDASNIVISWSGSAAYNVKYVDQKGNHCATSCIVRNSLLGGPALYWREPPEV